MTGEERLGISLRLHELSCDVARAGIRHHLSPMENEELAAELDRNYPIQDVEFYFQKYKQAGLTGDDLWNKIIEKALTTNPEVDSLSGR